MIELSDGSTISVHRLRIGDKFVVCKEDLPFKVGSVVELVNYFDTCQAIFKLLDKESSKPQHLYIYWGDLKKYEVEFSSKDFKDGMVITFKDNEVRYIICGKSYRKSSDSDDLKLVIHNPTLYNMSDILEVKYLGEVLWQDKDYKIKLDEINKLREVVKATEKDLNEARKKLSELLKSD